MAAKGTSIKIFLVDGTPDGLRLIEKSLWTGIGVVCSRNQYPDKRGAKEFDTPGIYVLYGPDPDVPGGQTVYIGQAEVARQRLDQHSKGKDFWTHLMLFTNKDASFNNAHFRYLEARLIQRGLEAKRAKVMNGNQPSMPKLSEADVADTEAFLENMLLIYPLMGIDAFEVVTPSLKPGKEKLGAGSKNVVATAEQFTLTSKGVTAKGRLTPEGFVVEKGSGAVGKERPSFDGGYKALRDELIGKGILVPDDDALRFSQNYPFRSPSAAGAVVRGAHTNGRLRWKAADGRTLAEVQAALIDSGPDLEPPASDDSGEED